MGIYRLDISVDSGSGRTKALEMIQDFQSEDEVKEFVELITTNFSKNNKVSVAFDIQFVSNIWTGPLDFESFNLGIKYSKATGTVINSLYAFRKRNPKK